MALGKKTNWDIVQKQDERDKLKYLDVHGKQQMERSSIPEKATMTSRNILNGCLTFAVFILVWVLVSLWDMAFTGSGGLEQSLDPRTAWVHINEHYVNVDDPEDKITVDDYNRRIAAFASTKPLPEVKDPGDPPVYQDPAAEYEWFREGGHKEDPYLNSATGERLSEQQFENLKLERQATYERQMAEYEQNVAAYKAYRASVDNPADQYKHQNEHYRNGYNPEEYVLPDAYAKMLDDYDKQVRRGKLTDDELDIPAQPIKLATFYVPAEYGLVPKPGSPGSNQSGGGGSQWGDPSGTDSGPGEVIDTGQDGQTGEGDGTQDGDGQGDAGDGTVDGSGQDGQEGDPDGNLSGAGSGGGDGQGSGDSSVVDYANMNPRDVYMFDIIGHRDTPWLHKYTGERITNEQMDALCNAWDAFHGDEQRDDSQNDDGFEYEIDVRDHRSEMPDEIPEGMEWAPVTYRNIYDGSTITYVEYQKLESQYAEDLEAFKAAYQDHRKQYHPDDIDGKAKVFSMRPTWAKFLLSAVISAFVFGIMYAILAKNLKAQNLMSDPTDINQYYHDQHVALPEEVQRLYDWFPDVGAHSGVQVSSMISHMALSNKGLKKVTLAKRADKDIRDSEGDIEYYKGEILMDADGKPIADEVPMIDEKFMEDLFDASGALKDKEVRRRYDATKIPYNPDGSNRDKLGKFNTVADLINEDWEFPIYEPQRPGGAYIVDTAPVNTMVLAITRAGKGELARFVEQSANPNVLIA